MGLIWTTDEVAGELTAAFQVKRLEELGDDRLGADKVVMGCRNVAGFDRLHRAANEARGASVEHHDKLAWGGRLSLGLAV